MSVSGIRLFKVWPMDRAAQGVERIKIVKIRREIGILDSGFDAIKQSLFNFT